MDAFSRLDEEQKALDYVLGLTSAGVVAEFVIETTGLWI